MNRVFGEGLFTTILGVSILAFCGLMMYQQKASVDDLAGWFAFGCLLIRAKDSILGLENKQKN